MASVIVAFVPGSSPITADHFLNRWAAWAAPARPESRGYQKVKTMDKFIHCELLFPDTIASIQSDHAPPEMRGTGVGIVAGGEVFRHNKRYSRDGYIFKSVSMTQTQYDKMKAFCDDCVGCKFNHLGYASFFMPFRISGKLFSNAGCGRPHFFCSELCMSAFKAAGLFPPETPTVIHPDNFFTMIDDIGVVHSHPCHQHTKLQL